MLIGKGGTLYWTPIGLNDEFSKLSRNAERRGSHFRDKSVRWNEAQRNWWFTPHPNNGGISPWDKLVHNRDGSTMPWLRGREESTLGRRDHRSQDNLVLRWWEQGRPSWESRQKPLAGLFFCFFKSQQKRLRPHSASQVDLCEWHCTKTFTKEWEASSLWCYSDPNNKPNNIDGSQKVHPMEYCLEWSLLASTPCGVHCPGVMIQLVSRCISQL